MIHALLDAIGVINSLGVIGEPSPNNNIDTEILADEIRLTALLKILEETPETNFGPYLPTQESEGSRPLRDDEQKKARADRLIAQYREAVHLATKACNVQRDALINTLSRAYQKPDFCVRRDSVGVYRDSLLPRTLSWDEDWYAGNDIQAAILGEKGDDYDPA